MPEPTPATLQKPTADVPVPDPVKRRHRILAEFLEDTHAEVTTGDHLYPDDSEHLAAELLKEENLGKALSIPERIAHQITEHWRLEDREYQTAQAEIAKLRAKRDAEIEAIKDKYAKFGVTDEES
jgi:hypothetical protein